ncbi:MAG: kelch repeat-containing protein [Byssovorax sp.]
MLVAGGENGNINAPNVLASAELYDPTTNTWSSAGNLATGRYVAQAVLLGSGKVLVMGGANAAGSTIGSAELYDPATNTWSAAASFASTRGGHSAILLGNGQILAAGGVIGQIISAGTTNTSERYDPVANTWTNAGTMSAARFFTGSVALLSGDALVVGGSTNGSNATTSVDRYYFASLALGAACSVGAQCASGFCVDGVCCQVAACAGDACHNIGACQAGTGVCSTPNKPDGTACNDGNACTQTDTCQSGACTGQNPVVCMAQDQCHDPGACNP